MRLKYWDIFMQKSSSYLEHEFFSFILGERKMGLFDGNQPSLQC